MIPNAAVTCPLAICCLLSGATTLRAQSVEITPFGGYRFGGDFFVLLSGQPVDLDGAVAFGAAVNVSVPSWDGLQVEALFSREQAELRLAARPSGSPSLARLTVDHWLAGGLQEFGNGRARPFLAGLVGLTHYAGADDDEIRFTAGAGGGVKLFPSHHVGVRFDGRVYATFVDADVGFAACGGRGTCLLAFRTDIVWQAEVTAGVVLRFP